MVWYSGTDCLGVRGGLLDQVGLGLGWGYSIRLVWPSEFSGFRVGLVFVDKWIQGWVSVHG